MSKCVISAVVTHLSPTNTPANSSPDTFSLLDTQNDLTNSPDHCWCLLFICMIQPFTLICLHERKSKARLANRDRIYCNVQCIYPNTKVCICCRLGLSFTSCTDDHSPSRFGVFKGAAAPVTMTAHYLAATHSDYAFTRHVNITSLSLKCKSSLKP